MELFQQVCASWGISSCQWVHAPRVVAAGLGLLGCGFRAGLPGVPDQLHRVMTAGCAYRGMDNAGNLGVPGQAHQVMVAGPCLWGHRVTLAAVPGVAAVGGPGLSGCGCSVLAWWLVVSGLYLGHQVAVVAGSGT